MQRNVALSMTATVCAEEWRDVTVSPFY